MTRCQAFAPPSQKFHFKDGGKVCLLDATVIELPLPLFSRASYRTGKGAVKMQAGVSADGYLPSFADMTAGRFMRSHGPETESAPRLMGGL